MNHRVRVVLIDPTPSTRSELSQMLGGIRDVELLDVIENYDSIEGLRSSRVADLILIAVDHDPDRALDAIKAHRREMAGPIIVPASQRLDIDAVLRFVRAGAVDYLPLPTRPDEFQALLSRLPLGELRSKEPRVLRTGKIVSVAGASGGVGCTAIAVNLAAILAEDRRSSVALMDLDLLFGSVSAWLNLNSTHGLIDVLENSGRLDPQLLRRSMIVHQSTLVNVLPAPLSLEDVSRVEPDQLRGVIQLLGETFDTTIIDTSKSFHVTDMVALESSDLILLVVQSDLINLYHSARLLKLFRQLDGLDDRVGVVLNRAGSEAVSISIKKVEDTLGKPVICQIPNTFRAFHEARMVGKPIDRRGGGKRSRQSFEELSRVVRSGWKPHVETTAKPESVGIRARLWTTLMGADRPSGLLPSGA